MKTRPGSYRDVAALFERRGILARSLEMPGCLGVELSVVAPAKDEILATALWASPEAYQGWLASGGRADDVAELMPLLIDGPDAIGPSLVYEVLLSASPSAGE